jgi:hypothetical protein
MNETLLKIVEEEPRKFRERGGDDLVAEGEGTHDCYIRLRDQNDGRRHAVTVQGAYSEYLSNGAVYKTEVFHGIPHTRFYAMRHGVAYSTRNLGVRKNFGAYLGRMLDEFQGKFEPIREIGVAQHLDGHKILKMIGETLPEDGSIMMECNTAADPQDDQDYVAFIGRDGAALDFRIRTAPGKVIAYDGNGDIAVFERYHDFDGLREAVEAGLVNSAAPRP